MPPRRYARKSYKPRRNYKKKTYARKGYKKNTFAKKVRNVVHRMAEKKTLQFGAGLADIVPMSAAQYTNLTLLPTSLLQGATSSTRIGNKIEIRSSNMRMYFTMKPYSATNLFQSPIQVCIWVYSFRTVNAYAAQPANVQDLVSNNLFQLNNASTGTTKTIQDLLFSSNKDFITVHRKIAFTLNTPTSAASSTGFNSSGNPYKWVNVNLSNYVKQIQYNDLQPGAVNKNLFMLINTYHTDGSVYPDAERAVAYTYVHTVQYDDI